MRLPLAAGAVDLDSGAGTLRDRPIRLTTREREVLAYLAARPGRSVPRDELRVAIWGSDRGSRACDGVIAQLRIKLEADPAHPDHLLTDHGTGYRFVPLTAPTPAAGKPPPRPALGLGPVRVDLGRGRVHRPDGVVDLTAREVALLERLARQPGHNVPAAVLVREVWGAASRTALTTAISRLRAKIEPESEPRYLLTAGDGYRLEVAVRPPITAPDLVDRVEALAAVRSRVADQRWTLIVGPAGVGKSALARAVAASEPVAWWVDPPSTESPPALAAAIAGALGVELGAGLDPVGRVIGALRAQGAGLLVLDELEGIAEAGRLVVAAILDQLPDLRVLGTCRSVLGVRPDEVVELDPLVRVDGTELFRRRAGASFRPRPEVLADVGRLVDRLDGLPLAIELAAARTSVASPAQLLIAFDRHGLDTLDPAARPGLRSALDASWGLLDDAEREALIGLSLFGWFDLDDAVALFGPAAIDRVHTLRRHSWISERGDGRLRLLTTTREYVDERRAALTGQGDPLLRRQIAHLARLGERQRLDDAVVRRTDGAIELLARRDDLEMAARRALALGEPGLAARCGEAAVVAWRHTGPSEPARALVDTLLAHPGLHALDRAILHYQLAAIVAPEHPEETVVLGLTAAAQAIELGAAWLAARSYHVSGMWPLHTERLALAEQWAIEAGDEVQVAYERFFRFPGPESTRALHAVARRRGDRLREALAAEALAREARDEGRTLEAIERYDAALVALGPAAPIEDELRVRIARLALRAEASDDEALGEEAAELERRSVLDPADRYGAIASALLGSWRLRVGRIDEAREGLVAARRRVRATPLGQVMGAHLAYQLARVHLAAGNVASAAGIARDVAPVQGLPIFDQCELAALTADARLGDRSAPERAAPLVARLVVSRRTAPGAHAWDARIRAAAGDRVGAEAAFASFRAAALLTDGADSAEVRATTAELDRTIRDTS